MVACQVNDAEGSHGENRDAETDAGDNQNGVILFLRWRGCRSGRYIISLPGGKELGLCVVRCRVVSSLEWLHRSCIVSWVPPLYGCTNEALRRRIWCRVVLCRLTRQGVHRFRSVLIEATLLLWSNWHTG